MLGATREGAWLSAGPLDPGIRLSANDEMLRIGNAAGEAHPIIGEGMSMALQSAWLLCAQLLRQAGRNWRTRLGNASSAHLCSAMASAFAARLRLASAFAHLAMRPSGQTPAGAAAALARTADAGGGVGWQDPLRRRPGRHCHPERIL